MNYVASALIVVSLLFSGVTLFSVNTLSGVAKSAISALSSGDGFGGTSNFDQVDTTDGYSVDSTTVINGSGAWVGAISTSGSNATVVGTFTQGGGMFSSSTSNSSETLVAADFDVENYLKVTPNVASLTLTLPATSTLTSFVPTAGQCRTLFVENGTTTAAVTLTLATGTGWDFHNSSSTLALLPGANASIQACRNSLTDIEALIVMGLP